MAEYIVTSFKVMVGVITAERLAISAVVALCLLALWIVFSLAFSFQGRFSRSAKKLNEHISRNGLKEDKTLSELISKMPSEFQRGYKNYNENKNTLPSQNIKRFDSLDVELNGGVFNQNKSVIKTYINFVFMFLLLFSVAIISSEEVLTAYALAEAAVIPLTFLLIAKVLYYVYTAIRQYQYKVAVDDFNDLVDNLDQAHKIAKSSLKEEKLEQKEEVASSEPKLDTKDLSQNITQEIEQNLKLFLQNYIDSKTADADKKLEGYISSLKEIKREPEIVYVAEKKEKSVSEEPKKEDTIKEEKKAEQKLVKQENKAAINEIKNEIEQKEETSVNKQAEPIRDEFSLEPEDLVKGNDEPAGEQKRGRGRPKKEVNQSKEFVIKTDKDFEEALVRAEKLMRKNEEPLSASQTKRIEKQIKDLVDAMTKYKEQK